MGAQNKKKFKKKKKHCKQLHYNIRLLTTTIPAKGSTYVVSDIVIENRRDEIGSSLCESSIEWTW